MNDPAVASVYPSGPQSAPINYWHLWAPIFQQLGIDPASIPEFAPILGPQGPGLPAWQRNNPVYQVDQQQAPATPAQLQAAQLSKPMQPLPTMQQPARGLLSPQGMFPVPQQSPGRTERQPLRGLLTPAMWS